MAHLAIRTVEQQKQLKKKQKKSGKILEREHHHHRDRCVRFNASGLRERQRNVPGMEGLDS